MDQDVDGEIQAFFESIDRASWAFVNLIGQDSLPKWTPVLTFATPGNLSVTYSAQTGRYLKLGILVVATFNVATSAFTHTSASGACQLTGLPVTSANITGVVGEGTCRWQGITKANYTDVNSGVAANDNKVTFTLSGSGQNIATLSAGDMPTGGNVILRGMVAYFAGKL